MNIFDIVTETLPGKLQEQIQGMLKSFIKEYYDEWLDKKRLMNF